MAASLKGLIGNLPEKLYRGERQISDASIIGSPRDLLLLFGAKMSERASLRNEAWRLGFLSGRHGF